MTRADDGCPSTLEETGSLGIAVSEDSRRAGSEPSTLGQGLSATSLSKRSTPCALWIGVSFAWLGPGVTPARTPLPYLSTTTSRFANDSSVCEYSDAKRYLGSMMGHGAQTDPISWPVWASLPDPSSASRHPASGVGPMVQHLRLGSGCHRGRQGQVSAGAADGQRVGPLASWV